jgi:hypothetical protein
MPEGYRKNQIFTKIYVHPLIAATGLDLSQALGQSVYGAASGRLMPHITFKHNN